MMRLLRTLPPSRLHRCRQVPGSPRPPSASTSTRAEVTLGDTVTVTFTLQNSGGADIELPPVKGLNVVGTQNSTNITIDNNPTPIPRPRPSWWRRSKRVTTRSPPSISNSPAARCFTPKPMKFHASQSANTPSANVPQIVANPAPGSAPIVNPPFNPNGPVTMPPGGILRNPTLRQTGPPPPTRPMAASSVPHGG